MNGGGAGAGQAGDEDRLLYRHVGVLRVLLERRFADEAGHQCTAHEEPLHLAAELGEVCLGAKRLEQYGQRLAVVVVVAAEVVESAGLGGRGVQVLDGADVGARHALYSRS